MLTNHAITHFPGVPMPAMHLGAVRMLLWDDPTQANVLPEG